MSSQMLSLLVLLGLEYRPCCWHWAGDARSAAGLGLHLVAMRPILERGGSPPALHLVAGVHQERPVPLLRVSTRPRTTYH
jgi:hypothetical protein